MENKETGGKIHPLIAELLKFGRVRSWAELAASHGFSSDKVAQTRWARWAAKNNYPISLTDSPPEPLDGAKPPPIDFSNLELRRLRTDADDNPLGKTYLKRNNPHQLPDLSGYELEAVTTNPHGGAYLKYRAGKLGFDPKELKNILAELGNVPLAKKDWHKEEKTGFTQVASIGDIHIGMDSTDNVFGYEWKPEKALQRALKLGSKVDPQAAKIFLIIGGDLNDGQDGKTTRKGHNLPQNLGSREQIENSVRFCLNCLDSISSATDAPIEVIFLSDSNHGGGVMDYAVGLLLEYLCPHRYSGQIDFKLQESFIGTYKVGELDFIICHGYDEKHMPRGLPRFLSKDNVTFFERVADNRKLEKPVLWRFDQHQYHVIEYPKFTDLMTKAFSTPSSWVSLNFAATDAGGFVLARVEGQRLSVESVDF